MNVVSLFNGMGCIWLALDELGIKVSKRYVSEIDKYANKVNDINYPDSIHLGDVRHVDTLKLPRIDLLAGGSPCQSFSFAGKRKGMSTKDNIEITTLEQYLNLKQDNFEFEGQSYLFWEYVRILKELKPKYFLLENVLMEEKWEKIITKTLGVHPIMIDSALVSAQRRRRLYWTNIGLKPQGLFGDLEQSIQQPKDLHVYLKDILEPEVDEKYYLSEKALSYIFKPNDEKYTKRRTEYLNNENNDKSVCVTANFHKGIPYNMIETDVIVHNLQKRSSDRPSLQKNKNAGGSGHLSKSDNKSYCLDTANSQGIELIYRNETGCIKFGRTDEAKQIRKENLNKGKDYAPYASKQINQIDYDKMNTLTTSTSKDNLLINHNIKRDVIQLNPTGQSNNNSQLFQQNRIYDVNGIAPALCKEKSDLLINYPKIRRLTPTECARLQTVPDHYIKDKDNNLHVSETQTYKMLGNGWTIKTISHILSYLKDETHIH